MSAPPVNELGVVYLFSDYAQRHSMRIHEIRAGYPDAVVIRHTSRGEERMLVEFEFRSSNFRQHGHDHTIAKKIWIVCWEDDWPDKPRSIGVIELRNEYGLGWGCWWHWHKAWPPRPTTGYCVDGLHPHGFKARADFTGIDVPASAKMGDLVFCWCDASKTACKRMGLDLHFVSYFPDKNGKSRSDRWLLGLSRITEIGHRPTRRSAGNCVPATIRRVVAFDPVILASDVFNHPSVNTWDDLTSRWPEIRRRLIHLRPDITKKLARYG